MVMTIGQVEEAWKDLPKDTVVVVPDYDFGHNDPVARVKYNPEAEEVELDTI
jgi:hypothetical protein